MPRTPRFIALCVGLMLAAQAVSRAAEPSPPQDEWWKKASPPKRHGPVSWSLGVLAGMQDWNGLEDLSPSDAQRAAGLQGAFDTTSATFGIVGSVEVRRFGTIGVGVDMFADTYSNQTSEDGLEPSGPGQPGTPVSYEISTVRLGLAGRALFRSSHCVQPTASLGLALASNSVKRVLHYPGFGDVGNTDSSPTSLDLLMTGGLDVAFGHDVRRGLRGRVELGVEHRGYDESLSGFENRSAGSFAYRAVIGLVYRHEPATAVATSP